MQIYSNTGNAADFNSPTDATYSSRFNDTRDVYRNDIYYDGIVREVQPPKSLFHHFSYRWYRFFEHVENVFDKSPSYGILPTKKKERFRQRKWIRGPPR